MIRPYLIAAFAVAASITIPGCLAPAPNYWAAAKAGQKKVLVSFPPLYSITHAVAGDDAYVLCLLTTQGPHDYDGGPTDPIKVKEADLVIWNGLGLDDVFVKKMLKASGARAAHLDIGEMLEGIHPDLLQEDKGHMHADGKLVKHGKHDAHVWLGVKQAMAMTTIIKDKLASLDPAHQQAYDERAAKFLDEFKKLQAYGDAAFKDKASKTIVTQHESMGYFTQSFGLKVAGSIQVKPGADPDAKSLADLVELCQKEKVRVIAVEPQYSRTQAETIKNTLKQKGLDIVIVQVDPLETAPVARAGGVNPDPGYYLTKMRENIDNLARALP